MDAMIVLSNPAWWALAFTLVAVGVAGTVLPMLPGTILVLAMFFVALNLVVDIVQTALDPRIRRT